MFQKTIRSKRMEVKRELLKQYNLPNIPCTRWGQGKSISRTALLKGMLWTVFAKYIRIRDSGFCISCGRRKPYEGLQAGHYIPVGNSGLDLWFDEKNVNGECPQCNAWNDDHLKPMRINLIIKYGRLAVENLEKRQFVTTPTFWPEQVYVDKIKHYYKQINKSLYGR